MAWLCAEFKKAARVPTNRLSQLACEMTVIRMHDAWARFCRDLIVLSAAGNTITVGGTSLAPSRPDIHNSASVIPILLTVKRWRYEPKWATASIALDAARSLSIQNLPNVSAALGAANSPAEPLRHIRNYYAHRRRETSTLALGTGYFTTNNLPDVIHLNSYTSGGLTVIESWVKVFDAVACASIQ